MRKKKRDFPESSLDSLALTEESIRKRAYELFEQRGYEHGHDVDDWLQAKAELMEKEPTPSADETPKAQVAKAA
jgi:hypothetical protein